MKLRELPYGNGQEVYIEPDWLKEEYHEGVFNVPNHDKSIVKELVEHLDSYGYKIITDSKTVNDDVFFFNPCLDKHVNKTKEDYINKKNVKILNCLSNGLVKPPLTMSFPPYDFPNINEDVLPIVIKNEQAQGGEDKYIIRTLEQLKIFKKFYYEINDYDKKRRESNLRITEGYKEDVVWDEQGHSKQTPWSISVANYKKDLHENFVIQKFIKTPTKYNTSLRVVTSSSGEILCASLKYADEGISEKETYNGMYDQYLSNPASPYYLGGESIISNTVAGGKSILLGSDKYLDLEKEILIAHGIDYNTANVPHEVVTAATKIAITCKRSIGAISGMGFIFDEEEQNWKFLEQHEYPMLNTYAEAYENTL